MAKFLLLAGCVAAGIYLGRGAEIANHFGTGPYMLGALGIFLTLVGLGIAADE